MNSQMTKIASMWGRSNPVLQFVMIHPISTLPTTPFLMVMEESTMAMLFIMMQKQKVAIL